MLTALRSDLLQAIRALCAAPATSALSVVILAAGIAAGTIVFSVVDAIVLRSLPFPEADRLVAVAWETSRGRGSNAAREYLAWRERADGFEALAAVHRVPALVQWSNGEEEGIPSARVTASLFDVLRSRPAVGRVFTEANEVEGHDDVVVIGHGLWMRRFGGDPAVVGRKLRLGGRDVDVVGVMPLGFTYPVTVGLENPIEIWTPYIVPEDERSFAEGRTTYLHVVGRLRDTVTADGGRVQLETVNAALVTAHGRGAPDDWQIAVQPLDEHLTGGVRGWMLLALWAVALVMVVACVNVASLLLTRAFRRTRDFAVRASLGASRGRLVRMALFESLSVSLTAAAMGVLVAYWGIEAVKAALPADIARASSIALDARVLMAATGGALLATVASGLAPAAHVFRIDLMSLLKDGPATIVSGRRGWRAVLLVAEVAFVTVLLVCTALVVGSFIAITRVDLGFERANLVAVAVSGFKGPLTDLMANVRGVAGVEGVAAVAGSSPPLIAEGFGGGSGATRLSRADGPLDAERVSADMYRVSPGYFEVMRQPFRAGRPFDAQEEGSVILDEQAASRLFGDRAPVGLEVKSGGSSRPLRIVGVVASVGSRGPEAERIPQVYLQLPATARNASIVIRTSRAPSAVIPAIETVIERSLPAGNPVQGFAMDDAFSNITAGRRFNAAILSAFGILALLIGAAGVYGVIASLVAQRTQEIGVRLALGASRGRITVTVLGDALRYVASGLAIGLAAAWPIARVFESLLFGLRSTDASVYVTAASVMLAAGLLAALAPALRAARVDPMVTLRGG
jgi:putative ABC transport system permease protein